MSHAEHEEHGYRAIEVGDLRLGSIDGSVTRMADTPANRGEFGSAGTADDSAPYPQLRDLPVTDASTRGMLAVVTGRPGATRPPPSRRYWTGLSPSSPGCSPRAGCS